MPQYANTNTHPQVEEVPSGLGSNEREQRTSELLHVLRRVGAYTCMTAHMNVGG